MQNTKISFIFHMIAAFFSTWALSKAGRFEAGNILTLILFLLTAYLYQHISAQAMQKSFVRTRMTQATVLILSVLFTVFYMAVDYNYYVETLTNPLFRITVLCAVALGFVSLFYYILLFLFSYTGDKSTRNTLLLLSDTAPAASDENRLSGCRFFYSICTAYQAHPGLISFFICLLCWLPYFLYLFPGVMTPDSVNQFEQVLKIKPYSNHHPIVHTMLIKLFYHIGLLFTDNMTFAFSFYTIFQMLTLAFSIAFFIQTLKAYKIRPVICFIITLFYALIPYHAVYAVTIWKDILFAAAVLIFSCCLLRLQKQTSVSAILFFIISGIMLCLFRSNGWYGFLLCFPFLLFVFRKKAKRMYLPILAILLIAVIIKYPVMNHAGVKQPDFIESLSIPTQQIACVIANDRPLTDKQQSLIEEVIAIEHVKDLYVPTFADNMKELVRAGNQDYLAAHKGAFFKLWLELLFSYPGDYLQAYIGQTHGYFYPDSFYPVADAEGISASKLGVAHTPLIRGPLIVKIKEISIKLGGMLPLYGTLWSMGVIFWIFLFCIGNCFVRREYYKLICYLPTFAVFATIMIATPVATEFRYVYFMVFSLPFYLMTVCISDS